MILLDWIGAKIKELLHEKWIVEYDRQVQRRMPRGIDQMQVVKISLLSGRPHQRLNAIAVAGLLPRDEVVQWRRATLRTCLHHLDSIVDQVLDQPAVALGLCSLLFEEYMENVFILAVKYVDVEAKLQRGHQELLVHFIIIGILNQVMEKRNAVHGDPRVVVGIRIIVDP